MTLLSCENKPLVNGLPHGKNLEVPQGRRPTNEVFQVELGASKEEAGLYKGPTPNNQNPDYFCKSYAESVKTTNYLNNKSIEVYSMCPIIYPNNDSL